MDAVERGVGVAVVAAHLCPRGSIPKTTSGKRQRQRVSRHMANATPWTPIAAFPTDSPVPTDTDTDVDLKGMCRLWERVLGLSFVAPDDDFFELGGTSLHAASITADPHCHVVISLGSTRKMCRFSSALKKPSPLLSPWVQPPMITIIRAGRASSRPARASTEGDAASAPTRVHVWCMRGDGGEPVTAITVFVAPVCRHICHESAKSFAFAPCPP